MKPTSCLLRSIRSYSSSGRVSTVAPVPVPLISELRKTTGASIQKCKEALQQSDHDMSAAINILRKHGEATYQKRSSSESAGCKVSASISSDGHSVVITKTTSLTDFASASEIFVKFSELATASLHAASTKSLQSVPSNLSLIGRNISSLLHGSTLEEVQSELSSVLAEPVKIDHLEKVTGDVVGVYVHGKSPYSTSVGSAVSSVALTVGSEIPSKEQKEGISHLANMLARQVMATVPIYIRSCEIPISVVENERHILSHKVTNPTALEKAFTGHMKKFVADMCLMDMEWIIPVENQAAEAKIPTVQEYMYTECKRMGLDPSLIKVANFIVVK